jgi:hypothetical protein
MKHKTYSPAVRAWAARKARDARQRAAAIRSERLPSADWRGIRGKARALDTLREEATRLERIALSAAFVDEDCEPF